MNKWVIGVLAFLIIVIAALGAYSYVLNKELIALTELQKETGRQITSLQGDIKTLSKDIASQFEKTASQIEKTASEIEQKGRQIEQIVSQMEQTQSQIARVESRIDALSTEVADIPTIDSKKLYEQVKPGVVEVVTEVDGKESINSGFILDPKGYIVTAYHVVEKATKVEVVLYDGNISDASIVGYCPYSDVAVLRLHRPLDIHALKLGDSNAVAVGDLVMVIGHPFDLPGTVTLGIVSQKGRHVEIKYDSKTRWVDNLIQCDAAVNFGNSGGPLINSKGEVIGLTIARIDPQKGEGIYYFVSSNKVKRVALSVIDRGSFDYPWLGIGVTDLTPKEARARKLNTTNGTRVTEVLGEGPAAAAGVKVGDIIIAIDGISVHNTADLTSYLGENKSPNEIAMLMVIRDGQSLELPVKLGKRES